MLQRIVQDSIIYTNQIVQDKVFKKLYLNEKVAKTFKTKVITRTHHPFATFLSKDRKDLKLNLDDPIILRAIKNRKKFEFITKLKKWGKFSIPKIVIKTLNIKNRDKILFEIIGQQDSGESNFKEMIDLGKLGEDIKVIHRSNDYITLYKKYKTPITLPRFIGITSDLIELCFLIHGDGHYKDKLYFVNKNSELHKFVIEQFEKSFRIPKNTWRARLLFNNLSSPELAKKKWKEVLNLKEEQFYPSISKCVLKTSETGNIRIVIDKTIVSVVFRKIFGELMELDKINSFYALNGLLYAEGGARKNKQGLHKITLSFNHEEKEMFRKILERTEIEKLSRIQQHKMFVISGWSNLYEFFKLFFSEGLIPFDKHNERCENALNGFLNHSFTSTMIKYLNILNKKESFTLKELVGETNHLPNSILKTLKKSQYSKFINIHGKGVNRNPLIISVTKEGKDFIKLIEVMKEVYNEKCRLVQNKEK